MYGNTKALEKQCTWYERPNPEISGMGDCLRAYAFKDKCGQPWGYAWIFKGVSRGYLVLRYVFGGRTRHKTFPTAYQALKAAKASESLWDDEKIRDAGI